MASFQLKRRRKKNMENVRKRYIVKQNESQMKNYSDNHRICFIENILNFSQGIVWE